MFKDIKFAFCCHPLRCITGTDLQQFLKLPWYFYSFWKEGRVRICEEGIHFPTICRFIARWPSTVYSGDIVMSMNTEINIKIFEYV